MRTIRIETPLDEKTARSLCSGDKVLITGTLYTGRDAAHMRLMTALDKGECLPFDPSGQMIYYVGPSPTQPGGIIGACGPTTSYRMDDLTVPLLKRGLRGMIGKGERSDEVVENMKKFGAVYLAAIGGAGALIASTVLSSDIIAYEDLGAEAIRKLEVKDFPAIVVIDSAGNNLYTSEREKYKTT